MMTQTTLIEAPIIEQCIKEDFFTYIEPKPGYQPIYDKIISLDGLFKASFPELKGKGIKVKITNEYWCGACWNFAINTVQISGPNNSESSLESLCALMFHELTHARHTKACDIPGGERATDLYGLARLPVVIIEKCLGFHYIRVPEFAKSQYPGDVGRLANEAIIQRSLGLRQYIKWFENECAKLFISSSEGNK